LQSIVSASIGFVPTEQEAGQRGTVTYLVTKATLSQWLDWLLPVMIYYKSQNYPVWNWMFLKSFVAAGF